MDRGQVNRTSITASDDGDFGRPSDLRARRHARFDELMDEIEAEMRSEERQRLSEAEELLAFVADYFGIELDPTAELDQKKAVLRSGIAKSVQRKVRLALELKDAKDLLIKANQPPSGKRTKPRLAQMLEESA